MDSAYGADPKGFDAYGYWMSESGVYYGKTGDEYLLFVSSKADAS